MNTVNFLGLTNKEPISTKLAKVANQWQKEDPKVFGRPVEEKEECSQGAALCKLHELGFKAHCQIKGQLKEIKPNFWQEGQPLAKGPELYKGLELGYYKLTKVAEEAGIDPGKVGRNAEEAVWDSSNFTYAEIKEKIAEVETKYTEIMEQKRVALEAQQVKEDEGFFSKELDEVDKFFGVVNKEGNKNLQVFS